MCILISYYTHLFRAVSNLCQTRLGKGFLVMCKFLCKYLIFKILFHVLYGERRMHYENDQLVSLTYFKQSKGKQMAGEKFL